MRSARRPADMDGLEFYGLQAIYPPSPRFLPALAKTLLVLALAILAGAFFAYLLTIQPETEPTEHVSMWVEFSPVLVPVECRTGQKCI